MGKVEFEQMDPQFLYGKFKINQVYRSKVYICLKQKVSDFASGYANSNF